LEYIKPILDAVRSPKLAAVFLIVSASLLFLPEQFAGIEKPAFTAEYQTHILLVFLLSSAVLAVEILGMALIIILLPFERRREQRKVDETFYSLNLPELCVMFAMTQMGTRTIKGSYDNPVMISLREKGCLTPIPGPQGLLDMHHRAYPRIWDKVKAEGFGRFPKEFRESSNFEDEVERFLHSSTTWRTY